MLNDFSQKNEDEYVMDQVDDCPSNSIHPNHSNTKAIMNMEYVLSKHMCFNSKELTIFAIKQFHVH